MKLNQTSSTKMLDLFEAGLSLTFKVAFAILMACLVVYLIAAVYVGIFELPNRYERAKQQYAEYQEKTSNFKNASSSFSSNE